MDDPKLTGFDTLQTSYKKVGDHEIRADILIPKSAHTGKRPTIIRYHGGGLVMGDSLFMFFFPHWLSDLALEHGAIIVSPNYRLLPEATSPEIYVDIEDFWSWLHSPAFTQLLANHSTPTEADLNRILTAGDSAGGLLSIYTALAHPQNIRSATASYPWTYPSSESFTSARSSPPFGHSTPESAYTTYMETAVLGTPKSSIDTQESLGFMLAAVEHGHLAELYERGTEGVSRELLYPGSKLEVADLALPRAGIAIIHGRQDSVVPVGDVERFVERAREVGKSLGLSGPGVTLTVREGEHGFDGGLRYAEEDWMRGAFKDAVNVWLE